MTESSEAYELSNVVETALAKALVLAAEVKRWDVVLRSLPKNFDDGTHRPQSPAFVWRKR